MDDGLTKSIGLSNASLPQVEEILAAAKHKPMVNQVLYAPDRITTQYAFNGLPLCPIRCGVHSALIGYSLAVGAAFSVAHDA